MGQTLLLSFRGSEAPDYVLELLRERRVAGVVLFGPNVVSRGQLRRLTRQIQRAAGGRAVVATDQEGGSIRQVPWARPVDGQAAQGSERAAASAARDGAIDLRSAGVNVNLAPIADVGDPTASAVGGRAYPGGTREVAASVRAVGACAPARRRASDAQALPRLRRRSGQHRRRAGDHRHAARADRRARPSAVRRRAERRRSARDVLPRALPGARPQADRLAVPGRARGAAARPPRLPRGHRHRQHRGRGGPRPLLGRGRRRALGGRRRRPGAHDRAGQLHPRLRAAAGPRSALGELPRAGRGSRPRESLR